MIRRVFVDADVLLDVALAREPFVNHSRQVLALLENSYAAGFLSSNIITNLYYILRKAGGDKKARQFISQIITFLTVITIEHSDVLDALSSQFDDFEDSVQHFAALRNQCDCIVTRNFKDYLHSKLPVYSPIELISLY